MRNSTTFALLILLLIASSGCRKDPDPEPGFGEAFYIQFRFQDQLLTFEENDVQVTAYWSPGPMTGWANHFDSGITNYDIELSLELGKRPVSDDDLKNLEGVNLAIQGTQFPRMRLFLIKTQGGNGFCTGVDPIDYGESECVINEVRKGPKIDVNGENKRSYILRGNFEFNISKDSWSLGEEVILYPVTDGRFSIRVYLPSE